MAIIEIPYFLSNDQQRSTALVSKMIYDLYKHFADETNHLSHQFQLLFSTASIKHNI